MSTDYTKIFHTVPYASTEIARASDGKKTYKNPDPATQPANTIVPLAEWSQFTTRRNQENTPVLAAIALEDFIGIDIDNTELFTQLKQLAPDCQYIAVSLPLNANKGGHLLFQYNPQQAQTLRQISKYLKKSNIDAQTGKKLIYLATPANKTKVLETTELTSLDQLTPLPAEMMAALTLIALPHIQEQIDRGIATTNTEEFPETSYGFILGGELSPNIVPQLTPKREYPLIEDMNDIPSGHATNWMLQVRKKLQTDPTVSPEAFTKTIHYLDGLWNTPRGPSKQLRLDIDRDIHSPDWKYNKDWHSDGFIYENKLGHATEVMYDPDSNTFVSHNRFTANCHTFDTQTTLVNSIVSTHRTRKKFTGEQILKKAKTITIQNTPELPPLLSQANQHSWPDMNLYIPSEGSKILQNLYTPKEIIHPKHILGFFENLIPDEANRERFLKFIAYKHTHYEHSPLYFVMAGVGGAGKGVAVNIILRYFSDTRLHQADLSSITNNFNAWMATTDWLEIEEAGEGYSNKENERLVGTLKKLTGNPNLTIERKGKDVGTSQRHYMTPIISTNMNTKLITDTIANDRRLVLFKCPNKLEAITNDTRSFIHSMIEELPSFAYYIKNLPRISHNDYHDNRAWKTEDYVNYIEDTTSYTDKLFESAEARDLPGFIHWLHEMNIAKDTIDSMFSLSIKGKEARLLLYNTTATSSLHAESLQGLAEKNSLLDTNIKSRFKTIKNKRSYDRDGRKYTLQVIEFTDTYVRLGADIAEVEGEDINL